MALEIKGGEKLKGDLNVYGIFLLAGLALFILFLTSGNKIYSNVTNKIKENKDLNSDIALLSNKVNSLKQIDKTDYSNINTLSASFPEEESSLFMFSTLKELATKYSLTFSEIAFSPSASTSETGEVSSSKISFVVTGTKENVTAFLLDVTKSAPLSGLGTIAFTDYPSSGGEFKIGMQLIVYYSQYPKTLPDMASIISPLNDRERETLDTLKNLQILVKFDLKPQEPNKENEDPFLGQTTSVSESEALSEESPSP